MPAMEAVAWGQLWRSRSPSLQGKWDRGRGLFFEKLLGGNQPVNTKGIDHFGNRFGRGLSLEQIKSTLATTPSQARAVARKGVENIRSVMNESKYAGHVSRVVRVVFPSGTSKNVVDAARQINQSLVGEGIVVKASAGIPGVIGWAGRGLSVVGVAASAYSAVEQYQVGDWAGFAGSVASGVGGVLVLGGAAASAPAVIGAGTVIATAAFAYELVKRGYDAASASLEAIDDEPMLWP